MRSLTELGILERQRQRDFPGSVAFQVAAPGRELIAVADVLQCWLAASPDGRPVLGSIAAKSAIKALVDGWNSAILRAIAARPFSLTELNKLISSLNYPSLERRLGALRLTRLIEPSPSESRGTPYLATPWLRRAIAPLAVCAEWERRHVADRSAPIGRIDVETAFLLAMPIVCLPPEVSGSCRMAVEIRSAKGEGNFAGVRVEVREGRLLSCGSNLRGDVSAWVSGGTGAWLDAVIRHDLEMLEVGGDYDLARGLLDGLHSGLFRARQTA